MGFIFGRELLDFNSVQGLILQKSLNLGLGLLELMKGLVFVRGLFWGF